MSTENVGTSTETVVQPSPTGQTAAPSPTEIEVREDSVLKFGDQKVPFSKYRGIESEYTKATQERSKLQQELQQARQQAQQYEQQIRRGQQQPQRDPAAATLEKLRSLPYLSGEEAAGVVEQIIASNRQQQSIAYMLAQRLAQLEQSMTGVRGQYANQNFSAKIAKIRDSQQIPERFQKRLEELYLAYEGDDLDEQFPAIAKEWYSDIQAAFKELQTQKIQESRRGPFVPGRGGQGSPSKPLEFSGAESVAEQADKAWKAFGLDQKE